ncbi:hypothetical protein GCM10010495_64250 [Kitasatospora herbaricolor]|nr:hypothetical protein GCM10010495_64250 [Kitasatospora herbaricolor]
MLFVVNRWVEGATGPLWAGPVRVRLPGPVAVAAERVLDVNGVPCRPGARASPQAPSDGEVPELRGRTTPAGAGPQDGLVQF